METSARINRVAVIAGDVSGARIALICAAAGIPTIVKHIDQRKYDGFDNVDIVIDAAPNDPRVKKGIFEELPRVTRADCILATHSAATAVDELATVCGSPERVLGHHFFNPVPSLKVLEILRGRSTRQNSISSVLGLGNRLGVTTIVVNSSTGAVVNRLLSRYLLEAECLVRGGVTPQQVDDAMTGIGMTIGPFQMRQAILDEASSLDSGWWARSNSAFRTESTYTNGLPLESVNERRSGPNTNAMRDGAPKITTHKIVERMLLAFAKERARLLEEGAVVRASDIDVICCEGLGFPLHAITSATNRFARSHLSRS